MAFRNLPLKINWRLIVMHFIAACLFIYAFKILVSLHDHKFVLNVIDLRNAGSFDPARLTCDVMWLNLSGPAGLVVACLISLFLCIKKGWHWANTLIVAIIAFLLDKFDLLGWSYLQSVFVAPGDLLNLPSPWYYLLNGGIVLAFALVMFFSKGAKQFIGTSESK